MSLRSRFQNWLNNAERRRDERLQRAKTKAERDEIRMDFQRHKTAALADLREQEARLAEAEARKRRAQRSEPRFSFMSRPKKKKTFQRDTRSKEDIGIVHGLKPTYKTKRIFLPEKKREKSPFEGW